MTDKPSSPPPKKQAPRLKEAAATQRMSKDELAELIKKAEEEDENKDKDGADVDEK
jgi:hypothetical protein